MRFIGGKALLLPDIMEMIGECGEEVRHVSDLFSGSGVVTRHLKEAGYSTTSNDLMYFSYVLLRGSTSIVSPLTFEGLRKAGISSPIDYLNNELSLSHYPFRAEQLFIYNHYSPVGGRMYFTEENALMIDLIRLTIEAWYTGHIITEDEYFYLLCALL